jgi:hypothetical protein
LKAWAGFEDWIVLAFRLAICLDVAPLAWQSYTGCDTLWRGADALIALHTFAVLE